MLRECQRAYLHVLGGKVEQIRNKRNENHSSEKSEIYFLYETVTRSGRGSYRKLKSF